MKTNLLKTVFSGVAVAMGVAVIVTNIINPLSGVQAASLLGIGVAKLITPIIFAPAMKQVIYYLFLQFLPPTLRDILLVIAGAGLMLVSLNELNKSLLNAFARRDRGDLSGIFRNEKTHPRKSRHHHE